MRRDDYILALTSGLLTVDDAAFANALAYFKQFYEMQEPAKPGSVSLAGNDKNYIDWLTSVRAEGVRSIYCYWYFEPSRADMPAHIEAAFAGSSSLVMQVTTSKGITTYRLRTLLSPQYEMNPQQFAQLIDAQTQKDIMWKRVEEVVNGSNQLNDKPIIAPGDMPRYLQEEGREVYNYIVSQVVQEVQVECEVMDTPFVIPEALQSLLAKSEFSFYGDAEERTPVFLYPTANVTADELLQLVKAQPFSEADVWTELERALNEWPTDTMPATGWPGVLQTLDEATVNQAAHSVCRAIATLCEQRKLQPIIPAHLLACIGPDELDGKRAHARGRVTGGKAFYLQSIQHPWELYLFAPIQAPPAQPPANEEEIRAHFISALKQITALAQRMQTPYAEAFQCAAFLSGPLPAGNFDDEHENQVAASMQQKGFSEQAAHIFRNNFSFARDHHQLQWPAEKIFAWVALSMADVFGGMGSWNDLDPGNEEALEYQRLSADLFETLKRYFSIVLSNTVSV